MLEGCGFVGIVGYMYSCDTRQQQQYFIACICARTDISASLVTPHFGKRKPTGIEYVLEIFNQLDSHEFDGYVLRSEAGSVRKLSISR